MDVLTLSRVQFALTSIYHFFFVPLTLGFSVIVALMETVYVRSGNPLYLRMAKFWGKLFVINFAMGVGTGLVQEFQFGMNWSQFSRFIGDIFGAPLAIEGLLAFFLESTFLGIWIFGWEKLSKGVHNLCIWLVALGSNLSALWILIANSFMQNPVGFLIVDGRAVMNDFGALIGNPNLWVQFPHTALAGFTTGAFFVMGVCIYHFIRKTDPEFFRISFNFAAIFGGLAILLTLLVGHRQAQYMVQSQPMKMAAAEALWTSADPASLSLFTWGDQRNLDDVFSLRIPRLLSLLAYNRLTGRVEGIRDLQATYQAQYGPGNYVPSVFTAYWSFRLMIGAGMLMFLFALYAVYLLLRNLDPNNARWLRFTPLILLLPYMANTFGWTLTEMGRQPWIVYGLMKTSDAVSNTITPAQVWTSLIGFTLLYTALMVADIYLLQSYARRKPEAIVETREVIQ